MKIILLNFIALLLATTLLAQPTTGLVGYFNFNNNLTNNGSATITATSYSTSFGTNSAGTANTALQFGGSTSSYVSLTDNGNLDFTGDFTISFAVYLANNNTQGLYDNGLNYSGLGIWYWNSDNTLRMNFKNGSIGAVAALPTSQWKAVCAVRSGSTLKLYVNGVLVTSGAEGTQAISYPYPPVLGQMYFASGSPANYNPASNGTKIDELRFYNRALSDVEIQSLVSYTLPLQLFDFSVRINNNAATLLWKTENEKNILSFDVEQSIDGIKFNSIATISALNKNEIYQYEYIDKSVELLNTSKVYYRLKQNDFNGKFIYSTVRVVSIKNKISDLELFPNPVINQINFTVKINHPTLLQAKITDHIGRLIKQQQWNLLSGNNYLALDVNKLLPGSYVVELTSNDIKETKLFIKQ